jgi:pyroglutamyl-peptidase
VETCRVPCEFRRAIETVVEAIERVKPTLVICLGQASGRAHLSVERVAINVDDARIADNGGVQPVDEPIAANGPPAYFATLPIKRWSRRCGRRECPLKSRTVRGPTSATT